MNENIFFHIDIDAFFASVEQIDNPKYKGKPVIVGGLPNDRRSVVSTCSYEARKFGVHSAMPTVKAFQLCPEGIFLRGRMKRYQEKSHEVMSILKNFSPDFQQMSIDEAFIDMTGTERLFGKAEDVAKKIKSEIFEKTGLTISIGIAQNKYLAKIASGILKPNGLYIIKNGDEENFMLNLPLKDVWGIGNKTLARLNTAGIKTTKDLHNCSLALLTSIFGQATSNFLYNAVRGKNIKSFDEPVKHKSISSEQTFEFDLTDAYTIETSLMQLSTEVFFRLLKEEHNGKTVGLKIRYEDFSTINIQETSSTFIISSDDLFERANKLFKKKYEIGRGIRLLGISVQNVENNFSVDNELFDFDNNKKKQTLEKTVLDIQKKNPSSILKKARLMIKNIIFSFLGFFISINIFPKENEKIIFTLPILKQIQPEAPKSIFQYSKDNNNVEFLAEGFWESKAHGGTILKINNGKTLFSLNNIIFEQQVDLSMWFLLNKKWFFETNFSDYFTDNTFAFGYQGEKYLKHTRIGNNGIIFPDEYPIKTIAKGNSHSPGFMINFSGSSWQSDSIIRYDNLIQQEKHFLGNNEVFEKIIPSNNWEQGRRFALPEKILKYVLNIYIEDEEGIYFDSNNRKYKKLSESEYFLQPSQNLLSLAKQSQKNIIISFSKDSTKEFLKDETQIFIDNTESFFLANGINDFSKYINTNNAENYFTKIIDNEIAYDSLIIQSIPFFSPFYVCDLYFAGTSNYDDCTVISNSTKKNIKEFSAQIFNENLFQKDNLVSANKKYIKIFNNIDLLNSNYSDCKKRFPLAIIDAKIYLYNKENDINISLRTFSKIKNFDIGTKASNVKVYINGILSNANYNSKTGFVTLLSTLNDFDSIKITWLEQNENVTNGAITIATGFKYNFSEKSFFNIASSLLWSYVPEKIISTPKETSPGHFEFATQYFFENNFFKFKNTLFSNINIAETTGKMQIYSIDLDQNFTSYLSTSSLVKLSENIIPKLNKTNYPELLQENKIENYLLDTVRDTKISGYAIKADYIFSKEKEWFAYNIDLTQTNTTLANAETFSIALRNLNLLNEEHIDFDIFLQLGISANNKQLWENSESIPTWKISHINADEIEENVINSFSLINNTEWQTITIMLTETERSKFTINNDARIIFVAKNEIKQTYNSIEVGPYELLQNDFLIESENTIQKFSKYFHEIDIFQYEKIILNFSLMNYLEKNDAPNLKIFFSRPYSAIKKENALSLTINKENYFENLKLNNYITIDIKNEKIFFNDKEIFYSQNNFVINKSIAPTFFEMNLEFENDNFISITKIENITLENPILNIDIKNKTEVEAKKVGAIWKINNINLLSDAKIKIDFETEYNISKNIFSYASNIDSTLKFTNFEIQNQFEKNNYENNFSVVLHKIKSLPLNNIFKYFHITENFILNRQSENVLKQNSIKITPPLRITTTNLFFETQCIYENNLKTQNVNINLDFSFPSKNFIYKLETKLFAKQNENETIDITKNNYFNLYKNFTQFQFSTGKENSILRNEIFNIKQTFNFKNINFAPYIYLEAKNNFIKTLNESTQTNTIIKLVLPFKIKKNSFTFSLSKEMQTNDLNVNHKNYFNDANEYFNTISKQNWFAKTIPFADLFSKNISQIISENNFTNNTLTYFTSYDFTLKRPIGNNGIINLFLPISSSLTLSRDIQNAKDGNTTDINQIKTTFAFTSLNCFGKFGQRKVFTFYEQDEYIAAYSISLKFNELFTNLDSYLITGYSGLSLYLKKYNIVSSSIDFQFIEKNLWNAKTSLTWKRNIPSSFIINTIINIVPSLTESKINLERKNILYYQISDYKLISHTIGISHELKSQFGKFFTLTGVISMDTKLNEENNIMFELIASLIGKIKF